MTTRNFKAVKKYFDASGNMAAVEFQVEYTHEDGETKSIAGAFFEFKPEVMSLPLPTSASTNKEIEEAVLDSGGSFEVYGSEAFHLEELDLKVKLKGYTVVSDDDCEGCADCIRGKRDALLSECDWWASTDLTMTQEQIDYRQALRDITSQAGFPESITWPVKP